MPTRDALRHSRRLRQYRRLPYRARASGPPHPACPRLHRPSSRSPSAALTPATAATPSGSAVGTWVSRISRPPAHRRRRRWAVP